MGDLSRNDSPTLKECGERRSGFSHLGGVQLRKLLCKDYIQYRSKLLQDVYRFLFGVEDCGVVYGSSEQENYLIILNQNVDIEMVSSYSEIYPDFESLPLYTIFPDDYLAGKNVTRLLFDKKFTEEYEGYVFYVTKAQYNRIAQEIIELWRKYGTFTLIPDSWYAETELIKFLTDRVIKMPFIAQQLVKTTLDCLVD